MTTFAMCGVRRPVHRMVWSSPHPHLLIDPSSRGLLSTLAMVWSPYSTRSKRCHGAPRQLVWSSPHFFPQCCYALLCVEPQSPPGPDVGEALDAIPESSLIPIPAHPPSYGAPMEKKKGGGGSKSRSNDRELVKRDHTVKPS